MANKMIIDASHPEETRVVVLRGNRVEEFDFESASKRPLRGNIYLAKVTRVEPSLQAAFIDYGGNRHGFLAFSEIHPDYYQIPVADRQALLEEEALSQRDDDDELNGERRSRRHRRPRAVEAEQRGEAADVVTAPTPGEEQSGEGEASFATEEARRDLTAAGALTHEDAVEFETSTAPDRESGDQSETEPQTETSISSDDPDAMAEHAASSIYHADSDMALEFEFRVRIYGKGTLAGRGA